MSFSARHRGFTLIELMVVISIIGVLMGVLTASFFEARQGSRDKERVGDLAAIEFAIGAYREANGHYPLHDEGVLIGVGESIDTELSILTTTELTDPVADDDHRYYYHSNFECNDEYYIAVLATTMEQDKNANLSDVCAEGYTLEWDQAHVFLVEGPLSTGGFDFQTGTDAGEWWNDPANQVDFDPAPPEDEG